MANYFKERERNTNVRLREIRDSLPEFCDEFFVGIEPQTTSLTRLNYAYDLRIFSTISQNASVRSETTPSAISRLRIWKKFPSRIWKTSWNI